MQCRNMLVIKHSSSFSVACVSSPFVCCAFGIGVVDRGCGDTSVDVGSACAWVMDIPV